MYKNTIVVIVMGYGCHLTPAMRGYLDSVIAFKPPQEIKAIITTGGYTNRRSAPKVSEAGMMATYLQEHGVTTPLFIVDTTTTTNENLKAVDEIMIKHSFESCRIVIFCDRSRSVKVQVLGKLIFGDWPDIKPYNLTTKLTSRLKQLIVTPLDIMATRIPILRALEHWHRERIMDRS